jgi:hypothetical protein
LKSFTARGNGAVEFYVEGGACPVSGTLTNGFPFRAQTIVWFHTASNDGALINCNPFFRNACKALSRNDIEL